MPLGGSGPTYPSNNKLSDVLFKNTYNSVNNSSDEFAGDTSSEDSEDDYTYDPDYPEEEESTDRLMEQYKDRPQEFLEYQEKRVENLCNDYKNEVDSFLEERKESRPESSEDNNELKEYDKDTEKEVKTWIDEFCSNIDGINRCRDDVLSNTDNDDYLDQASKNDEAVKDDVKRHQENAINNYYGNNDDNGNS